MDEKRIEELAARSRNKNIFVYTDFLNEQAQAELVARFGTNFVKFWGGAKFAERKIARFGDENQTVTKTNGARREKFKHEFNSQNNSDNVAFESADWFEDTEFADNEEQIVGNDEDFEDFPLRALRIHPLGGKFSEEIRHRDTLGAIMSLGIVREKVGDIFVADGDCFAVLHTSVARFVEENLVSVGRNNVKVSFADEVPSAFAPKRSQKKFSAQSNRVDNILCGVFDISREKACQLAELGKVFVNGSECEKPSKSLKIGDVVSARGFGKFKFLGEIGTSRKGKTYFSTEVFE